MAASVPPTGGTTSSLLKRLRQQGLGPGQCDWIHRQLDSGAQLTLLDDPAARWLGPRVVWWPGGQPPRPHVGIVSSRLGRLHPRHAPLFRSLRAACDQVSQCGGSWLVAERTTTARFARACQCVFGLRLLWLRPPPASACWQRWLAHVQRRQRRGDNGYFADLSPPLERAVQPEGEDPLPVRDVAVVAASDRLVALRARPGGHVDQLLRRRLLTPGWPAHSVQLAVGEQLVDRGAADELFSLGATPLNLPERSAAPAKWRTPATVDDPECGCRSAAEAPVVTELPAGRRWLLHWTRHQTEPWPDETEQEYWMGWVMEPEAMDRSAQATLRRILVQQRLRASPRGNRGQTPVVCFAELAPAQLPGLRRFRCHRGRWDFELFGLCICSRWLEQQGVRPVRYGDEPLWQTLPVAERPYFQLRRTRGARPIDWSEEREWRGVGDLDLRSLAGDQALVFVPSREHARQIAPYSRWPILLLPASP